MRHCHCHYHALTQWVWLAVFIVYHFVLFCRPDTQKTVYHFLTQNQIQTRPNISSVHPTDSVVRKLADFDSIRIRTPSCTYPHSVIVYGRTDECVYVQVDEYSNNVCITQSCGQSTHWYAKFTLQLCRNKRIGYARSNASR